MPARLGGRLLAATAGCLREHADAPAIQRAYRRDLTAWLNWRRHADIDPRTAAGYRLDRTLRGHPVAGHRAAAGGGVAGPGP